MASLSPEFVIAGLVQRGYPLHVAQGVTARLNGESGLNPGINEINPTVEGSRGGYGLAQWTGPRRRQYEAFAADRGVEANDPEAQLDFLAWENQNTEKAAWDKVMTAQDAVEAAELFTTHWERPGTPHLEATLATARQYSGISPQASSGSSGAPPQAPQNALAGMQQQPQPQAPTNYLEAIGWQSMQQDVTPFLNPRRNALAAMYGG
jgi:hypothetical protein